MRYDEMLQAIKEAKATLACADHVTADMASIIAGRLRKGNVSAHILKQLKRELKDFNIHTGSWRA